MSDPLTVERLQRAWTSILAQYWKKAVDISQTEGPGISMFRMLRNLSKGIFNSEYYYAEKDGNVWKCIMEHTPDREAINKLYDPAKHALIMVAVPIGDDATLRDAARNDTCQNIRLFDRQTMVEIPLQPI